MNSGDGDNGGIKRINFARHNCLQRLHNCGRCQDWIGGKMRPRRVTAAAVDGDFKCVRACKHGTRSRSHAANFKRWPSVQSIHTLHGWTNARAIERAILNHLRGAHASFFGGLEYKCHGVWEWIFYCNLLQHACRAKQHHGVSVMSAGVRAAGNLAAPCAS